MALFERYRTCAVAVTVAMITAITTMMNNDNRGCGSAGGTYGQAEEVRATRREGVGVWGGCCRGSVPGCSNLDDTLHYYVHADILTEACGTRWRGGTRHHSHPLLVLCRGGGGRKRGAGGCSEEVCGGGRGRGKEVVSAGRTA